ncbi:MAG: tRNA threonylcarbamoyladenosine dehydratase [Tepidanaerobacteraceae bacterium]|nr:tRNA threonylcarbamoyladenosine dehydratase [Thermoanaerobacterales bacterium]
MEDMFARTELLIGKESLEKLKKSQIAIIGIGGVGSFAVEALARVGVGTLILVDFDVICYSNINRQIHATHSTVGLPKVDVMKERILDINPNANVICIREFYSHENSTRILSGHFDYLIDAIDSLGSKIDLIVECKKRNIPIISAMGAGNKLNPNKLEISDISLTSICPLAKRVRKELRKKGIEEGVKVVYSKEIPLKKQSHKNINGCSNTLNNVVGSISFVPSAMGLTIASEVVRDLINI